MIWLNYSNKDMLCDVSKGNSPYVRIVSHIRAQGNLSEKEPMQSTLLYLFIRIFVYL